ncbi:MAG TPA: DUF3267 domain-containing protein [Verrucomicrobiae bacterium]
MTTVSQSKRIAVRLDLAQANLASIGTLVTGSIIAIWLAKDQADYIPFRWFHILFFAVGIPVLVLIHEAVHALAGMFFGKLKLESFKFGVFWHCLMPYCHCLEPVSVRTYRRVLIMPLLLTVPLFVWFLSHHPAVWSAILTAFSLSGCMGDLLIFHKLNGMKQDSLVLDSPDEAGCDVIVSDKAQAA